MTNTISRSNSKTNKSKVNRRTPKRRSYKKSRKNTGSKKKVYHMRHGTNHFGRTTRSAAPKRYYGRKYYGPRYSPKFESKNQKKKE
jgi:hypothetical protein